MFTRVLYAQDSHDVSDRAVSLPEKQAKARAILARTSAATLVSHEQVRSGVYPGATSFAVISSYKISDVHCQHRYLTGL